MFKTSFFFWKFLISHFLCLKIFASLKYLLTNRLFSKNNHSELLKILFSQVILFSIGSYFVGYKFYFLYWLLPYLTTFQMLTWFIELAEHYPMIETASMNLEASRNRFSHKVEAFFTSIHGENYHLVHHLFPAVPFWNLNKAHQLLMSDKDYKEVNSTFGGIFVSANINPSMWQELWRRKDA